MEKKKKQLKCFQRNYQKIKLLAGGEACLQSLLCSTEVGGFRLTICITHQDRLKTQIRKAHRKLPKNHTADILYPADVQLNKTTLFPNWHEI